MEFTQVMFEYDFDGVTPQECLTLRSMTGEELFDKLHVTLVAVVSLAEKSPFRNKLYDKADVYMSELFRRNMLSFLPLEYIDTFFGRHWFQHDSFGNKMHTDNNIRQVKDFCHTHLQRIKLIKEKTMTPMKAPLLSKQINDLMDEILDKNGNKPTQFKDFLTSDHYRKVRMGCDVSEWTVEEQEVLLSCLKKM
jgi:hypothetical protein